MTQLATRSTGSGPLLVFIHGIAGCMQQWDPVIAELEGDFTCLAVDLPGHGASRRAASYGVLPGAQAVVATVARITPEPAVYVGHSAGAFVALAAAAMGAAPTGAPARGVVLEEISVDLARFAARVRAIASELRDDRFADAFARLLAETGVGQEPPEARALIDATMRPDRDVVLDTWGDFLDAQQPVEPVQAQLNALMDAVHVPVLAVYGAGLVGDERRLIERLRNVEVEEWPGTGHYVHLSEPQRFAQRVRDFVSSLPPPAISG